jgi:hypothetical protein
MIVNIYELEDVRLVLFVIKNTIHLFPITCVIVIE